VSTYTKYLSRLLPPVLVGAVQEILMLEESAVTFTGVPGMPGREEAKIYVG
jgi:hypothetical protein